MENAEAPEREMTMQCCKHACLFFCDRVDLLNEMKSDGRGVYLKWMYPMLLYYNVVIEQASKQVDYMIPTINFRDILSWIYILMLNK